MMVAASASVGKFPGNRKRPPERRWRAAEGLTTRRQDLPMAVTHLMYPCPSTFGTLPHQEGGANG